MNTTKTTVPLSDQIDYIMDHFDFERVAHVMKLLDWTWEGETEPPSIPEMRKKARERLRSLKGLISSSSGGFHAYKDQWGQVSPSFAVEECDACDYCEQVEDAR